jgi:hypothetical protein
MPNVVKAKALNATINPMEPIHDQPIISLVSKSGTRPVKRTKW